MRDISIRLFLVTLIFVGLALYASATSDSSDFASSSDEEYDDNSELNSSSSSDSEDEMEDSDSDSDSEDDGDDSDTSSDSESDSDSENDAKRRHCIKWGKYCIKKRRLCNVKGVGRKRKRICSTVTGGNANVCCRNCGRKCRPKISQGKKCYWVRKKVCGKIPKTTFPKPPKPQKPQHNPPKSTSTPKPVPPSSTNTRRPKWEECWSSGDPHVKGFYTKNNKGKDFKGYTSNYLTGDFILFRGGGVEVQERHIDCPLKKKRGDPKRTCNSAMAVTFRRHTIVLTNRDKVYLNGRDVTSQIPRRWKTYPSGIKVRKLGKRLEVETKNVAVHARSSTEIMDILVKANINAVCVRGGMCGCENRCGVTAKPCGTRRSRTQIVRASVANENASNEAWRVKGRSAIHNIPASVGTHTPPPGVTKRSKSRAKSLCRKANLAGRLRKMCIRDIVSRSGSAKAVVKSYRRMQRDIRRMRGRKGRGGRRIRDLDGEGRRRRVRRRRRRGRRVRKRKRKRKRNLRKRRVVRRRRRRRKRRVIRRKRKTRKIRRSRRKRRRGKRRKRKSVRRRRGKRGKKRRSTRCRYVRVKKCRPVSVYRRNTSNNRRCMLTCCNRCRQQLRRQKRCRYVYVPARRGRCRVVCAKYRRRCVRWVSGGSPIPVPKIPRVPRTRIPKIPRVPRTRIPKIPRVRVPRRWKVKPPRRRRRRRGCVPTHLKIDLNVISDKNEREAFKKLLKDTDTCEQEQEEEEEQDSDDDFE